jgi:hypothetical protein
MAENTKNLEELLKLLNEDQKKFYNITTTTNGQIKRINYEDAIYSLLFIIHYLERNNYTLSHICLNDFDVYENRLFLNTTTHIYDVKGNYFSYETKDKKGIEFFTKGMNESRIHKSNVYESISYFIYYLLLHKVKTELTETDLEPIFETKPYYFIMNGIKKCFIYI